MQQVSLQVNERRIVQGTKHMFTNKHNVLAEAMQNARRAGSPYIAFDWNPHSRTLVITDGGCGIDDFQQLLTIAGSGWEPAIMEAESPFGMGSLSLIHAARAFCIESKGRKIEGTRDAVLSYEPITIEPSTFEGQGTRITLWGCELSDLPLRLGSYAFGFPIEVLLDNQPLPRPHASSGPGFVATDFGAVRLQGLENGFAESGFIAYLCGIQVYNNAYVSLNEATVIHLDPRQFAARLPDRDKLIDEAVQVERLRSGLRQLWRSELVARKHLLDPAMFIDRYFGIMRANDCLDLINDLPLLPRQMIREVTGFPMLSETTFLSVPAAHIWRSDLATRQVVIASCDSASPETMPAWMFMRHAQWLALYDSLPPDHWANEFVVELPAEEVSLDFEGLKDRQFYDGNWVSGDVMLCDAYSLSFQPTSGSLSGSLRHSVSISSDGLYWQDSFVVPAGETSGEIVEQVCEFNNEFDQFDETGRDRDIESFARCLRRWRASSPAHLLADLLGSRTGTQYPALLGHSFLVNIGQANQPVQVRQVPLQSSDVAIQTRAAMVDAIRQTTGVGPDVLPLSPEMVDEIAARFLSALQP